METTNISPADVLTSIADRYPLLTKSERKVSDYILQKKGDPQYMSITVLAEECGVTEATIFRFCKRLGFGGYSDFKLALAKSQGWQQGVAQTAAEGNITDADDVPTTGKKLLALYNTALNQTAELLNPLAVKSAAHILQNANRVYCLGQGGSLVIAMEAWSRFLTVSDHFLNIQDSHLQAIGTSLLTEKDAIWFFSYSGATKEAMDILRPAHQRGVKIILVTRFSKSPAAACADVVLVCGSNESPMQSGAIVAKIAQLYVIDMVYQEYLRLDPSLCAQNRERTIQAVSGKLL